MFEIFVRTRTAPLQQGGINVIFHTLTQKEN